MSYSGSVSKLPDGVKADFSVHVPGDECMPYIERGGLVYVKRGEKLFDGDVGLFFDGRDIIIRQYCEDWAGNAYLFALNRARRDLDRFFPAASGVLPLCYFGRAVNIGDVPLPEY